MIDELDSDLQEAEAKMLLIAKNASLYHIVIGIYSTDTDILENWNCKIVKIENKFYW